MYKRCSAGRKFHAALAVAPWSRRGTLTTVNDTSDKDAEAVSRALGGPPLEWKEFNGVLLSGEVRHADGSRGRYEVMSNHRGTRFYARLVHGLRILDRTLATFATADDAQAACEYHLMTSRWESDSK